MPPVLQPQARTAAAVAASPIRFGPFELDAANALLREAGRPVELPPKAFDVLCHLAARPQRLVGKDELLDAVWGHRFVSESVLKTAIVTIRQRLGDDARVPRYVETMSRRGYRFLAAADPVPPQAVAIDVADTAALVGLDDPLRWLDDQWQQAVSGRRRVAFVAGEAGIGKSTLLRRWRELKDARARIVGGQCVEPFGGGEPFLPLLEALGELAGGPDGDAVRQCMRDVAPTWLLQMPWLVPAGERAALQAQVAGHSAARMLRELGELLDRLADAQPLAVVLEDLHWSDAATVHAIDYLARRRSPARLLLLLSFRPVEARVHGHPLAAMRHELCLHRLCHDRVLDAWDAATTRQYLQRRCPGLDFESGFVAALHAHTDGLPLFVASAVDELIAAGRLAASGAGPVRSDLARALGLPDNLAGAIEKQILRLPQDLRRLLEAAAVAGMEFEPRVLAPLLDADADALQACCDELVERGQWLRAACASPGARPTGPRYRFGHALQWQVFYRRSAPGRRAAWHRRVAQALAHAAGADAAEGAAERALHHERGHEPLQAARQYLNAARKACHPRLAFREAAALAEQGLLQLDRCDDGATDAVLLRRQLGLLHAVALSQRYGPADPAARQAFDAALQAHAGVAGSLDWARVSRGVWLALHMAGRYDEALGFARDRMQHARDAGDPVVQHYVLVMLGTTCFKRGEFGAARRVFDEALGVEARHRAAIEAPAGGTTICIERRLFTMQLDAIEGLPPGEGSRDEDLPALADAVTGVQGQVWSALPLAMLLWHRRRPQAVAALCRRALARAEAAELAFGCDKHRMLCAWSDAVANAAPDDPAAAAATATAEAWQVFEPAYARFVAGHDTLEWGFYANLRAELLLRQGRFGDAADAVDAALAHTARTGERCHDAGLWLRRAEAARGLGDRAAAQHAGQRALEVARTQGAALYERWVREAGIDAGPPEALAAPTRARVAGRQALRGALRTGASAGLPHPGRGPGDAAPAIVGP